MKKVIIAAVVVFMVMGTALFAEGQQEYPSRTIEIVVPGGAGGGSDTAARVLQPLLAKELGVDIKVTNVPGGGHSKAVVYTQEAPADGYTLEMHSGSDIILDVFNKLDYKFTEESIPLARLQWESAVLWTGKNGRFDSIQELIAYAQKNPGDVTCAISTPGGNDDAIAGTFAKEAGIKLTLVPMDGGGEMMAAVMARHVDLMLEDASAVGDMMSSGEIIPLVVVRDDRIDSPELKDVPSTGELGLNVPLATFRAFAVKKGTPQEAVDILVAALKAAYDSPEYKKWEKENQLHLRKGWAGPDELADQWKESIDTYTKIFTELGRL